MIMNQFQVIVLATPIFFVLMGIEFAWGRWRERRGTGRDTYRFNDTVNSISLGF
jgi:alkylglycerol monooxygenase